MSASPALEAIPWQVSEENGPVGLAPGPWFAYTPTHGVPVLTARSTGKHACTSQYGFQFLSSCYQLAQTTRQGRERKCVAGAVVTAIKRFTLGMSIAAQPVQDDESARNQSDVQLMPTFDADTTEINPFEVEDADLYIVAH